MGVVEHPHDAHYWEAAARFLGGWLGGERLVAAGILKLDRAAIDRLHNEAAILVILGYSSVEEGCYVRADLLEVSKRELRAGFAISARVCRSNR